VSDQSIVVPAPFDAHLHLRERGGHGLLPLVAPLSAQHFTSAIVMPNLSVPVRTADDALRYRDDIYAAVGHEGFTPHMTIYLTPETTPKMVEDARKVGVVAAKLYIRGITTGAQHGVPYSGLGDLDRTFSAMQSCGMLLLKHDEHPGKDWIDAENAAVKLEREFVRCYPALRIVIEHVSTAYAVSAVKKLPETVAATITPHHLLLTMNDVDGRALRPHNFCLPHPKRMSDREALLKAAMSGNSKFFLGTDSAPHPVSTKECAVGCAGVFNAAVALPLLAQLFEKRGKLHRLPDFVSTFGRRFYSIASGAMTVTLRKQPWIVPGSYGPVVPLCAGQEFAWSVAQ
jgi:dihydroorotase